MIDIICACTDLGVHIDGADKGPIIINNSLENKLIKNRIILNKDDVIKEKEKKNLRKNFNSVNNMTLKIYNQVDKTIKSGNFPITLGGDHTVAIGSILASLNNNDDLGVIWIDAHTDYNTFDTTITGNIHGLPLASTCGLCKELTNMITNKYINPKKCVVVGARSIDKKEYDVLKENKVTIYTTEDIKNEGVNNILNKAFSVAGNNIHISYDLDVIDPKIAPGVSIPEKNGITYKEAIEITKYLNKNKSKIKSFDLVEYNPSLDKNNETLLISLNILNEFIKD